MHLWLELVPVIQNPSRPTRAGIPETSGTEIGYSNVRIICKYFADYYIIFNIRIFLVVATAK